MARRPLADRIAAERQKAAAAQSRARKLEAQAAKIERAKDTRRKALLGTLLMDELATNGSFADELRPWVRERLPSYLTRDTDEELMAPFLEDDVSAGDLPSPAKDEGVEEEP